MKARSIRSRLAAWYAAILALTLAAVGIGVWWAVRDSIHDTVDQDLRARLAAMRRFLRSQSTEPGAGSLAEELAEQATLAPAGTCFRIAGAGGEWIYRSEATAGWDPQPPAPELLPESGTARTIVSKGKPVRVLTARVPPGTVEIGIPIDEFHDMLEDFTWTMVLASPVVLMLASAGGYWMSRRALEPVARIARTAEDIGAQNLSQRLPVRGTADELDRLSETLNGMFARLETAFARITQFSADASHELRTPVAIIRTTAELARSRPRTREEYEESLDRILSESERTSALIDDLMLLARADAGAAETMFEAVDLRDVLRQVCAEVRVLAESAGVRLTLGRCAAATAPGDEQALRRLFLALLDNALKYTPRGGDVEVSMTAGPVAGRGLATIQVMDTGAGIPAADLTHIFERFYRATKDRSRTTGGVGLGLSIAHWIATRHGGEIHVESTPGVGSTFRVLLPVSA